MARETTGSAYEKRRWKFPHLDVTLFGFSILDVLPKMVADCSESLVYLHAEVTSESYGGFI